jgi:hypothetical protein
VNPGSPTASMEAHWFGGDFCLARKSCTAYVIIAEVLAGCFSLAMTMTKGLHILLFLTAVRVFDSLIMSASLPLKGKTICVTGASSGIGAAIAKVCTYIHVIS